MSNTVTAFMRIKTNHSDNLRSMFGHHIDWLIDIEGNADVITAIEGVETCGDTVDKDSLSLLKNVLEYNRNDLAGMKPAGLDEKIDELLAIIDAELSAGGN